MHSSRKSYKDKAAMAIGYADALNKARITIQALEEELDGRTERELELLDVTNSLMLATKRLSAVLHATMGDLGVGTSFDNNVDADLELCRPALVIARASVIMTHAVTRLDEVHTAHEAMEQASEDVMAQIDSAVVSGRNARDRRRRLLISNDSSVLESLTELRDPEAEYRTVDNGLTLADIYELPKEETSLEKELAEAEGEYPNDTVRTLELHAEFLSSDVRRHLVARRKFTETTGRVLK